MGVNIVSLLNLKQISYEQLAGKTVAIDSSNHLYQFLSNIRAKDGSLFSDSHGNITSHLIGMLSRTSNLLSQGIKPAFVFDGKMPELKKKEIGKRLESKEQALSLYREAEKLGDVTLMRKYASRTSMLTKEMIADAKLLARALGCPVIDAPSEAEAQASFIVRNNDAYAVSSQDADCLLFASPNFLRNLAVSGKRKKKNVMGFETIHPEMVSLNETLASLHISQIQLICLGMLVGTDYNAGGIKKIGPVNGLKLVKQYSNPDELFKHIKWSEYFEQSWQEVFDLLQNPKVTSDYDISFSEPNEEAIRKLLIDRHDFSLDRVDSSIATIKKASEKKTQRGLGDFI